VKRIALLLCTAVLAGCGGPAPLSVLAAASTREAMEETCRGFSDAGGARVECSFAASSTLARQIEQGAPADLFLSADERWADYLSERGLVLARRDLLGNRLVVVAPADSRLRLQKLADVDCPEVRRLALALDSVPAGRYGRQALQKAGVWDRLRSRVREAGDVRAALAYVSSGEVDAGIVYATDAAAGSVRLLLRIPEELHTPIRYPLVLLRRRAAHPQARRLYDYLGGDVAAFRRAGFTTLHDPP
jgi:molybdate transport system substrate-binding protein